MNPGQDFSIGRPVVKSASFDFSVRDGLLRARGRLVDKCMKDMAEKIFEETSLKKIHARLACDTIPLK